MFWIDVAAEKGWFREAGLDVELVDTSENYIASLDDVVNGRLDTHAFTLYDFLDKNFKGADLVMTIVSDWSNGADVLLASPHIRSISELKGKTIGVAPDSYLEFILDEALQTAGMRLRDVRRVPIRGEDANAIHGVDAVMTWSPNAGDLMSRGWHPLFDSSDVRCGIASGYAFRREFLRTRPEAARRFAKVWRRASTYVLQHPDETVALIAKKYRRTPAEVAAFAKLDRVLDLQGNLAAFSFGAGAESIHASAHRINQFMVDQNRARAMVASTRAVDPSFVRDIAASEN